MVTAESVKNKMQCLIQTANQATGKNDEDMTAAIGSLIAGFGQGGGGEWKHINTITLTEAVREVTISEDTDGNPFALTEVFIRQNVSCGADSNQRETVYVNGIGVIGEMDIVKNTGYYAWSDIVLSVEAGKIVVWAAYSDFALSNPGGHNTHLGYGTALKTFRNVSFLDAESIQTIKLSCTDVSQAFAQNSSFTIWGR